MTISSIRRRGIVWRYRFLSICVAVLAVMRLASADVLQPQKPLPISLRIPIDGYARSVAWSRDGRLLAAADGSFIHVTIWDANTGKVVQQLERRLAFGDSLAFLPGDKYLLTPTAYQKTPDDGRAAVSLWDLATGTMVRNVSGPFPAAGVNENMADGFSLDRDGRVLAVLFHGQLPFSFGIYETESWKLARTFRPRSGLAGKPGAGLAAAIAVSPDGKFVAVGLFGGAIAIYDSSTGALLRSIDAYNELSIQNVAALAFSPDSKLLLSAPQTKGPPESNALRVWNVVDGSLVLSFPLTVNVARGIAWSSDDRHIASVSDDNVVRLWDLKIPATPVMITNLPKVAWSVAFSPDGKRLAASGWGSVIIAVVNRVSE